MKMKILSIISFLVLSVLVQAQDTLPSFSAKTPGKNRVIISWVHTYGLVKQINLQRSTDSLQGFKTILNVADPMSRVNGFVDTRAPNDSMYYRLFVVLDRGAFYFTPSKRPELDTVRQRPGVTKIDKLDPGLDSVAAPVNFPVKEQTKPDVFVPSVHVFSQRDGNLRVNLPDAAQKSYTIKFYDEKQEFLFEIRNVKQTWFTLDKGNFYHAGWFWFELFDDDKLVEKHRFYLRRDF